ncbi:MAG: hypothetical protein Q9169_005028 [Polycauliona sp. 2 TL-2023]
MSTSRQGISRICTILFVAALVGVLVRRYWLDSDDPYKCRALLTRGHWLDPSNQTSTLRQFDKWQPPGCLMRQYTGKDIRACLNGQRIVYIGDSTTRQLFWATAKRLNATGANAYRQQVDKHEDLIFESVQFIWDPFLNSSSLRAELLSSFSHNMPGDADPTKIPGLVVVGGGLWYARHFQSDWLGRYQDALDYVAPLLGASEAGRSLYKPPSSEQGQTDHHVYMIPIQLPLYEALSPVRASTVTPNKVNSMNGYLFNVSIAQGIKVPWSHSLMTQESKFAYEDTGLHVIDDVASRKVDVLLNARCNAQMTYSQGYPFDKTCCCAYESLHSSRARLYLVGISAAYLVTGFRHYGTNNELRNPFMVLGLVLMYCALADRTQLFDKTQKHFMYEEFFALCAIVLLLGILSVRPAVESKPLAGGALSGLKVASPPFLSRDQSDEWKGWMQFIILIYHYTGASSVLGIYQVIRILVASYLFLTGFGHTIFFYRKQDYSLSRCASVLVRYNLLSCILPYIMDTDYLFYYFAPLVSFWYLVVYLTMRIGSSRNLSMPFLLGKIGVSAAVITILARVPIVFECLFLLLKYTCNIHWNVNEWQFRLQLDCYVVYGGMVAAIVYCEVSDCLSGQSLSQGHLSGAIRRHWRKFHVVSVSAAFIVLAGFGYFIRQFSDKVAYNRWVPFVSICPILAFVVLRNSSRHLRNFHSSVLAWLGRCSLETFTLQFHIWLAADTKGLLSLGLFGRKTTHIEGRYHDLVILTAVFFWLSWMTADATTAITNWIIDPNRPTVRDVKLSPMTEVSDVRLNSVNNENVRTGVFSRLVKKWNSLWMGKLEFRLAIIVLFMWILNMM